MTQEQRNILKQQWFKGCTAIRETGMPSNAKFFVGQVVVDRGDNVEIIGYYDYYGTLPCYLCLQLSGERLGRLIGIPFTVQNELYLKSEEHLHRKAKIIKMNCYFK